MGGQVTMVGRVSRRTLCLGAVASGLAAAAGCAPGGSAPTTQPADTGAPVNKDVAGMGTITLTTWDGESGSGSSSVYDSLNKAFQAKYPNVTIKRVSKSFDDHKTTLKLALSGATPPDVVQANQGYSDNAAFVKAGLLEPLTRWDATYGWTKRFPAAQIALNSVSPDGKTLGTGNLYGVSATGEVVGVWMNLAQLKQLGLTKPTTMPELIALLPKIKAAGKIGIEFGNSDKYPAIHLFGNVLGSMAPRDELAKLVFGQAGEWTMAPVTQAGSTIADWVKQGYIDSGYSGNSSDIAVDRFGKGNGVFFVGGNWYQQTLTKALGDDVAYAVLPGAAGGNPVSLGGIGMGWAIPSKSKTKDAAAAYIDYITGPEAMQMMAEANQLPAVPPESFKPKAGVATDVWTTWSKINSSTGLVPYLDWATPTFYDTITSQLQQLLAGREDSAAMAKALQTDYSAFRQG